METIPQVKQALLGATKVAASLPDDQRSSLKEVSKKFMELISDVEVPVADAHNYASALYVIGNSLMSLCVSNTLGQPYTKASDPTTIEYVNFLLRECKLLPHIPSKQKFQRDIGIEDPAPKPEAPKPKPRTRTRAKK